MKRAKHSDPHSAQELDAEFLRLIETEMTCEAEELFQTLSHMQRQPSEEARIAVLRCQHLLESRQLRACLAEITRARMLVDRPHAPLLDVLEANTLALLGRTRRALDLMIPIKRQADPLSEIFARASHVIGLCLYRRGHYKWAQDFTETSISYFRLRRNRRMVAGLLINLALVVKNRGNLESALDALQQAMSILPINGLNRTRLRILVNHGMILLRMGNHAQALESLMAARRLAHSDDNRFFNININTNLGHIYRMQGDYSAANEFYSESLNDSRSEGSKRQECIALEFLAQTAIERGRFSEAEHLLSEAKALATQIAPRGDLMLEVLRRFGDLYRLQGEHHKASSNLKRAISLCGSRGEQHELLLSRRSLLLAAWRQTKESSDKMHCLLDDLKSIGDQFEYMCTVYELLRVSDFDRDVWWFDSALNTALYYVDTCQNHFWKKRFAAALGTIRRRSPSKIIARNSQDITLETRSPAFTKCLELARMAQISDHPVLLMGETGVGKEVLAKLIHSRSSRAEKSVVSINCGAIPESLVDSELFGHAKGTFTGAYQDRVGLFEEANGGTVFLDELGELPQHTQVRLLRFLDTGEFRRVGETKSRTSNVRIISATNKNLDQAITHGEFREDLLYRINTLTIEVPPLRHRSEDIESLLRLFLTRECRGKLPRISDALMAWLRIYDWPGNIRELRNICQYLGVRALGKSELGVEDLPDRLRGPVNASDMKLEYENELENVQKARLVEALRKSDGVIVRAAEMLGMNRNTLTKRIREFKIDRTRFLRRHS